jgi:AraC-like DNA-binding protein
MIVVQVTDPSLRRAVRRAAHAEEDVVVDARLALDALEWGFPRLLVKSEDVRLPIPPPAVPVLDLDALTLRRWEVERRSSELPLSRLEYRTKHVSVLIEQAAKERTWVDGALAELARAAGAQLPRPLRTFARRILEFPVHYTTLHQLAEVCRLSRGALKAKFRRRGLASPYTYLRWLRLMAVADLLSDRSVTVAQAARRMGFTSDGNLCRMMGDVCGMTPTEVRTVRGWNRLLISFAWQHLTPEALAAWASLDELFQRRVA